MKVREFKSLVDIQLPAHACQEYYQNHIDSLMIFIPEIRI